MYETVVSNRVTCSPHALMSSWSREWKLPTRSTGIRFTNYVVHIVHNKIIFVINWFTAYLIWMKSICSALGKKFTTFRMYPKNAMQLTSHITQLTFSETWPTSLSDLSLKCVILDYAPTLIFALNHSAMLSKRVLLFSTLF